MENQVHPRTLHFNRSTTQTTTEFAVQALTNIVDFYNNKIYESQIIFLHPVDQWDDIYKIWVLGDEFSGGFIEDISFVCKTYNWIFKIKTDTLGHLEIIIYF